MAFVCFEVEVGYVNGDLAYHNGVVEELAVVAVFVEVAEHFVVVLAGAFQVGVNPFLVRTYFGVFDGVNQRVVVVSELAVDFNLGDVGEVGVVEVAQASVGLGGSVEFYGDCVGIEVVGSGEVFSGSGEDLNFGTFGGNFDFVDEQVHGFGATGAVGELEANGAVVVPAGTSTWPSAFTQAHSVSEAISTRLAVVNSPWLNWNWISRE